MLLNNCNTFSKKNHKKFVDFCVVNTAPGVGVAEGEAVISTCVCTPKIFLAGCGYTKEYVLRTLAKGAEDIPSDLPSDLPSDNPSPGPPPPPLLDDDDIVMRVFSSLTDSGEPWDITR